MYYNVGITIGARPPTRLEALYTILCCALPIVHKIQLKPTRDILCFFFFLSVFAFFFSLRLLQPPRVKNENRS